jgi:hypothetical protein
VRIKENENGITDAIHIAYRQKGNAVTVSVNIDNDLYLDTWVDFDVSVPREAGLTASVAAGTLEATALTGAITLNNTNGAIWASNLTGPMVLTSQSGSINTGHVRGQLMAITQNGTITTIETHLSGRSIVRAQSGTINFHGSLDPHGAYLFANGNGAVGITLPPTSAIRVTARTASGSINCAFMPLVVIQRNGAEQAHGQFGRAPLAGLTIETTSGSIDLNRGG